MRIKFPFFEKSSASFILKRSRGLGILTFDKIRKTVILQHIEQKKTENSKIAIILSENKTVKIYI